MAFDGIPSADLATSIISHSGPEWRIKKKNIRSLIQAGLEKVVADAIAAGMPEFMALDAMVDFVDARNNGDEDEDL